MTTPGIRPTLPSLEATLHNTPPVSDVGFADKLAEALEAAPAETDNPETGPGETQSPEEEVKPGPSEEPTPPSPDNPVPNSGSAGEPVVNPEHPPSTPGADAAEEPPKARSADRAVDVVQPQLPSHGQDSMPARGPVHGGEPRRALASQPSNFEAELSQVPGSPRGSDNTHASTESTAPSSLNEPSSPSAVKAPSSPVAQTTPPETTNPIVLEPTASPRTDAAPPQRNPAAPSVPIAGDPDFMRDVPDGFDAFSRMAQTQSGRTEVSLGGREGHFTVGLHADAGEVFVTARLTSRALLEAFDASAHELAQALGRHGLDLASFDTSSSSEEETADLEREPTTETAVPAERSNPNVWQRAKIVA